MESTRVSSPAALLERAVQMSTLMPLSTTGNLRARHACSQGGRRRSGSHSGKVTHVEMSGAETP